MRRWVPSMWLLTALSLATPIAFPPIQAQTIPATGAIAGGMAVSDLVERIRSAILETIERLDNSVSARSFQMRTELSFLLSEVEHTSLTLVDKTFGELNRSQQLFFERVETTIAVARAGTDDALDRTQTMLNQIESALAALPTVGEEPRVRQVSPVFIETANQNEAGEVLISIDGSFLRHGPAQLVIQNTACRLLDHRDNRIGFGCPKNLFVWETGIQHVTGLLTVEDYKGFWDRVRSLFRHYDNRKQYAIVVTTVPRRLGSFSVTAIYEDEDKSTVTRTGAWGQTAPHCRGETRGQNNFGPQGAGWEIDVNSIQTHVGCDRRGGHAVRNASSRGFQVEYWMTNSGQCVKVAGQIVAYDGRGCREGTVNWLEQRTSFKEVRREIATGDLFWAADVPINLPARLRGFTVTVRQIDGRSVVLNSASPERWFEIRRDAASSTLVIRPLPLAQAMRN